MSAKQRKALGRGFGALLKAVDDQSSPESADGVQQIKIDNIGFNPKQPRLDIDPVKLEELAQSIRVKGVIQPVLVRPKAGTDSLYELVAGERRLRASRLAGFDVIPAIVKPIKDQDLLEIALIENIQRDNLNAIEEGKAYRNLLEEHGYTQEDLSKRVGKNRSTIANLIRLLQLPESIQEDVASARISTGHARSLLALTDEDQQLNLRDQIINENASVRETERLVKQIASPPKNKPKNAAAKDHLTTQVALNQERLREFFSTKVRIKPNGKKGTIELEYYSQDDFNRLFSLLLKQ